MKKIIYCLLSLFLSWPALAQDRTVTGVVSDERGEPMAGATLVSGKNYAITGEDGRFTLTASQGATVTVSFLGCLETG